MRLITAIIRPGRYEAVRDALTELGVQGVTLTEVRGFGRQRGKTEIYRGSEYEVLETPKLRLEILVPAALAEAAVEALTEAARTGKVGDGVVYVTPVRDMARVRTGESGPDALG
ncbi:MAG: P-II family nitrogen regulator [Pseudomonadota bacterium]